MSKRLHPDIFDVTMEGPTRTRSSIDHVPTADAGTVLHVRRVYAEWDGPDFTPGDDASRVIELPVDVDVVAGRQPTTTELGIPLRRDGWASRRHAELRAIRDRGTLRLRVRDLGSRNGTRVDGRRLEAPVIAGVNQVVQIGSTLFVVGMTGQADSAPDLPTTAPDFHARSASMRALWRRVVQIARTDVGVLLLGEMGTGKTQLARIIHELGPRAGEPFVPHNCSAIPVNLEEATLFGVVSGFIPGVKAQSGLIARAAGGTLFLDELADLPERAQACLLDAFDPVEPSYLPVGGTRRVDTECRLISATNRDVFAMVADGRLRHDLLSRMVVGQLAVPPVRDRREDLLAIFRDALMRAGVPDPRAALPTAEIAAAMLLAPWIENARGIETLAQRVSIGEALTRTLIREHAGRGAGPRAPIPTTATVPPLDTGAAPWPPPPDALLRALSEHDWKVKNAAEAMGRRRETLARLLSRTVGAGGVVSAQRAWRVWQVSGRLPTGEAVAPLFELYFERGAGPETERATEAWRVRGEVPA